MIHHQGNNSKGNYNYNLCFYSNVSWAPHFHKNFELIYVASGNVLVTVNGQTEHLHEGDYALILSNQIHSLSTSGTSECWIAVFAEQFVPRFANYIDQLEGEHCAFRCGETVHALLQEQLLRSDCSIDMKKACFYAVCDEFVHAVPLRARKDRGDFLIGKIFDYVAKHYREPISLTAVAERFGYEYHYLSRLLRKEYRIHFPQLVGEYRITHAIRLLEETEKSVTEIAMESGFSNIRSFNHTFLSVTGQSPRDYRKQTARNPL